MSNEPSAKSMPSTAAPMSQTIGGKGENAECSLLGSFALFVQLALAGLALLSLVYKRWRERPQRPVKIWFFDVSKQVVGSALVHIANVLMSMLTSGRLSIRLDPTTVQTVQAMLRKREEEDYVPNPCSLYFLNLAIDTTVGIPILILLLRIITGLASLTAWGKPAESIQSGNYGSPPNAYWWMKQSLLYFCGLFGMKLCVLILFLVLPWISRIGDWALGWTAGNEKVQIVFVMMLFPLFMNGMQYYIIDSFIKKQDSALDRPAPEDGIDESTPIRLSLGDDDDDVASTRSAEELRMSRRPSGSYQETALKQTAATEHAEYDPAVDGQKVGTGGGGGSGIEQDPAKLLPKELIPRE